jgi:hypothetical protein
VSGRLSQLSMFERNCVLDLVPPKVGGLGGRVRKPCYSRRAKHSGDTPQPPDALGGARKVFVASIEKIGMRRGKRS